MFRSQTSSFGRVTVVEPLESRVFMAADAGTLLAGPRMFIRGGGGWDDSDTSLILPVKQVVTPPDPSPPPVEPVTSALGGNLNMQTDRVQDHPFTDLVKLTRGFYNLAGRLHTNGKIAFANTDANG